VSETRKSVAASPPAGQPQKVATELKVTGHLMTFETGLFCIFNAPGSQPPDQQTGLPGVRVSLPPGPAHRPEAVKITAFRDDGWLGGWDGAALVRVIRGPAQVLVTVYQEVGSAHDAPRLQVLRLTEGISMPGAAGAPRPGPFPQALPGGARPGVTPRPAPAMPGATPPRPGVPGRPVTPVRPVAAAAGAGAAPSGQASPAGGAARAPANAEMVAHIQGRGDVAATLDEWMGEAGSKRWIEGFAIAPRQHVTPADIEYQAVLGRGWLSPWVEGGQFCGSRGMSLPILGLRVRLRGEAAEKYDCAVTATFVDGSRSGPLDNGDPCQAESLAPLESFRIELQARDVDALEAAVAGPAAAAAPASGQGARRAAARPKPAPAPPAKPARGKPPVRKR
jgi:hypothetical protein